MRSAGKERQASWPRFLRDQDEAIQLLAIRSFPELQGISPEEASALLNSWRTVR